MKDSFTVHINLKNKKLYNIMENPKPNFRLKNNDSDDLEIVAEVRLKRGNSLENDRTFAREGYTCDCNTECKCDSECSCDNDNCSCDPQRCRCVDDDPTPSCGCDNDDPCRFTYGGG